jgi:arylsulfatase A-like enzyme
VKWKLLPTRWFWRGPWPWVIGAALLAAFVLVRWKEESERPVDPRPIGTADDIAALSKRKDLNVLFVLIDTLRASRLRTYGYSRPTSPFFDVVASQGVRFARHLSQSSWTKCSMASRWTGLYPQRSGITRFDDVIPQQAKTAAEVFRDAGFRTAGIWRNGWVEGYFGFDQGFDVYTRPNSRGAPIEVLRENPTVTSRGNDLDVVETAGEFLRIYGRERWFLYLHLMDVHEYTYTAESAQFGSLYSDVYDNAVLHVNQVLEVLFSKLHDGGYLDHTLLIVASDHGEAFGERGSEGHARNVYPEVTEIPLVFGLPFRLANPAVVRQRTANVDLWPTVLDLLGLPPLENADGRSRVPEILAAARGEPGPEDGTIAIAHLDQTWGQRVQTRSPNVAVSERGFRYLMFGAPDGEAREELYDAGRDARELKDLAEDEPEVAARMREQAKQYLALEPPWKGPAPQLKLDEIQLNQLRALGYAVPGR